MFGDFSFCRRDAYLVNLQNHTPTNLISDTDSSISFWLKPWLRPFCVLSTGVPDRHILVTNPPFFCLEPIRDAYREFLFPFKMQSGILDHLTM